MFRIEFEMKFAARAEKMERFFVMLLLFSFFLSFTPDATGKSRLSLFLTPLP